MNPLHKDDIEILDKIIDFALEKGRILMSQLPEIKPRELKPISKDENFVDIKLTYYKRYLEIIKEWEIADVKISGFDYVIIPILTITERFQKEGGFKKKYQDQQEEKDRIEIKKRKDLTDAKISEWTKKTYWVTFWIAILGLAIAILAFIRTL